jgi:hypothetical protein
MEGTMDNFKSAQHSLNWKALQIKRMNKKQPCKQFSEEERKAFAAGMGLEVSNKPPVPVRQRKPKSPGTVEFADGDIDLEQVPKTLLKNLGLDSSEEE